MKKLIPFVTPIVLIAFIYATIPYLSRAENPPTISQVAYSTDLQTWHDFPTVDLSTARANPVTGQLEIFVEIDLPYEPVMETMMFFKSISDTMTLQYLNLPIPPNKPVDFQAAVVSCNAGIIIGILIVVVGSIIIYYIIKACKRWLS
jgi:hypothetical protein